MKKNLLASFKVFYRVAKTSDTYTIAENLIFPEAVEMMHIMFGEKQAAKFKQIPLSNTNFMTQYWRSPTIQRRIRDMTEVIQIQFVENLNKRTFFSLQMENPQMYLTVPIFKIYNSNT